MSLSSDHELVLQPLSTNKGQRVWLVVCDL